MDNFAAQHAGTTVATIPADSWNAPRPLNVDDNDIWPGMTEPPKAKQAATDMIAPLARLELTVYKAKMSRTSGQSPGALEAAVAELEDLIQGKYLRYCDPTEPMHYTVMVGARAAILNARLRTRLIRVKRGIASVSEKNEVFTMALKLLDYDAAVMSGPLASRYAWQFRVFFSWEPLIGALQ